MPTTTQMQVHVRWMIRRDLEQVLRIERGCFEFYWDEEAFIRALRQRNVIGMVAEDENEKVVGYMIYELHRARLHLLNFAVHPNKQRLGVGRQMMHKLFAKLSPNRRSRILCEVRDSNLDAQLFFKAMEFRCISTLRDYYEDTDEDAYLMRYGVYQRSDNR